jgi:hypothetical protein
MPCCATKEPYARRLRIGVEWRQRLQEAEMGEKETMTGPDVAAERRAGTLSVSGTPGGSQTASLAGKLANPVETPGAEELAAKGPNAVNVKLA